MDDFDKKNVEFVAEWLKEKGFDSDIIDVFRREKIDGMAFTLMKPDIIKSMFPQMGPQLKLIHLHQQLIASQSTSITHDACLSVDQRIIDEVSQCDQSEQTQKPPKRIKLQGVTQQELSFPITCTSIGCEYEDYTKHLKSVASRQIPTQASPFWPYSSTNMYFRLALIKDEDEQNPTKCGKVDLEFVRSTIHGYVDDVLSKKSPVNLKDILSQPTGDSRRIVLIEGAPGSGKTTLSAYIFHEWGNGNLFQEYKAMIPLSLRDPAVYNANSIYELLSVRSDLISSANVFKICESDGQDVLLILDGWDELPQNKDRHSFIHRLLQNLPGRSIFHKSSIIVTSRPISSCVLHPIVSSRVEILGFDRQELEAFFTESLKGDTKAMKILMERIEEHPEIERSSYLPLNAKILVHLFISNGYSIPNSMYGIFHELVITCISRHCLKKDSNLEATSIDELPNDLYVAFMFLCDLAYEGIKSESYTFSDLPPIDTLGLLQGVERLSNRGTAVYYNFNHLAIQELLAAYYISKQKDDDQVSTFKYLLQVKHNRFLSVLKFYAAITRLQNHGVSEAVIEYVSKNTTIRSTEVDKRLLLFLLHCLYEVQESKLSRSVLKILEENGLIFGRRSSAVPLAPVDCLYAGHFLSYVCKTKVKKGSFDVAMINCGLDKTGCEFLMRGMRKCLVGEIETPLLINLGLNNITGEGVGHIAPLLQTSCLLQLHLSRNGNLSDDAACHLAEGLRHNTSLSRLVISVCGLTSKGAQYIANALKENSGLTRLDVKLNRFYNEGAKYFAEALLTNKTLVELDIENCGISDSGMEELANSLEHNTSLEKLILSNDLQGPKVFEDVRGLPLNEFTDNSVRAFIKSLQINTTIKLVQTSREPQISEMMQKHINEARKISGSGSIEVKSKDYAD